MPNVYFSHGTKNESYLLEDLIIESISIWGQEFYYIPRTLVGKDDILGEDRLSQFKNAYRIDMYLENVNGFEGQGAFINKFGLMMEQSASLTVAKRTWERLVGKHSNTIIPNRPAEGDLLYFPLTGGLFEIKFVEHQDPFYQLKKLYTYRLEVELFQYSSEVINTGVEEIDVFETLKTFDVEQQDNIDLPDSYGNNNVFLDEASSIVIDTNNIIGLKVKSSDSNKFTADSEIITADAE